MATTKLVTKLATKLVTKLKKSWEIVLGIGVDSFLKTNGLCGITACNQDKWLCKAC